MAWYRSEGYVTRILRVLLLSLPPVFNMSRKAITSLCFMLLVSEVWVILPFLNSCFEFCQCAMCYTIIYLHSVILFIITWKKAVKLYVSMLKSKGRLTQKGKDVVCLFLKISKNHAESLSRGWTRCGRIFGWLCFHNQRYIGLTVHECNNL